MGDLFLKLSLLRFLYWTKRN